MVHFYQDYYWNQGKPYGRCAVEPDANMISYKIITDPYHKRYSIEKYRGCIFDKIVYDSSLLDFRYLKPVDQIAWQREKLQEDQQNVSYLLRNHEDRAILIETIFFEKNWCRSCTIHSVHGIFLSRHDMHYRSFSDAFNGVILFDAEEHPVMLKKYEMDQQTGEFTLMLHEEWNMESFVKNNKEA